jgi:hypothetical protein
VLRYAAALAAGHPQSPSFLRRFADDPAVRQLAELVADARLSEDEHASMLDGIRERAVRAHAAMAGPDEIRGRLGVAPHTLAGHTEMLGEFAERSRLTGWEADPPEWLLTERAAEAAAAAAQAAHQAREQEQEEVLEAAGRALRRELHPSPIR